MSKVLILRPQPGARETAARALQLGLDPLIAPLFTIGTCAWSAPPAEEFDAVMLTSANAARFAGPRLEGFLGLPCYAVGESTAAAARQAGFAEIRIGTGDGRALVEMAARDGVARLLHLCGRDHRPLDDPRLLATRRLVYAAHACDVLPAAAGSALAAGAVALLHSPRAASLFAHLVDKAAVERSSVTIAAISQAAADAAGAGWHRCRVARSPRDQPLLELAAKLCKTEAGGGARLDPGFVEPGSV
jgi:uroporphyrinogen-III synthase